MTPGADAMQAQRPAFRVLLDRAGAAGAVGGVALLFLLPFVWTEHRYPLASFDNELIAALCLSLAGIACAFLPRADAKLSWPFPVFLLALGAIALVHLMLGHLAYSLQAGRLGLYLAAILAAYALGRQLVAFGLAADALDAIALAAMAGAAFSALVQWMQLFDLEWLPTNIALVADEPMFRTRPFANTAQSNHCGTYLGFGTVAALYWHARAPGRGRAALLAVLWPLLASGLAMTGARMGFLYLALFLALAWCATGLRPSSIPVRVVTSVSLLAGYLGGIVAVRAIQAGVDPLARLAEGSLPIRYELWRQALIMIWRHPLIGVGIGQFPSEQLWLASNSAFTVAANNCHNFVLQIAAESGAPVAMLAVGYCVAWVAIDLRSRLARPGFVFAAACLTILAIHSMLEFPLWYLYFSLPAALLLAIGEPETVWAVPAEVRRLLAAAGLATLGVAFALRNEYDAIAAAGTPLLLDERNLRPKAFEDSFAILAVSRSILFKPEAERLLLELKHPPDEKTDGLLQRSERVLRTLPASELIAYRILYLAQAGRISETVPYVERMAVFGAGKYPALRDWLLDRTRDLGPQTAPLRHALREQHWIVRPERSL